MVGMNQNAISRLESPHYGKQTLTSLKRLAAAFDVALVVRFVPFTQLVNWVSGTPFVDAGLSTQALSVPNFSEEEQSGVLAAVPTDTYSHIKIVEPKAKMSIGIMRNDEKSMWSPRGIDFVSKRITLDDLTTGVR